MAAQSWASRASACERAMSQWRRSEGKCEGWGWGLRSRAGLCDVGEARYRLGEEEVVLLGVTPQVLEDAALPVPLHVVPVLDDAMANRIVHS